MNSERYGALTPRSRERELELPPPFPALHFREYPFPFVLAVLINSAAVIIFPARKSDSLPELVHRPHYGGCLIAVLRPPATAGRPRRSLVPDDDARGAIRLCRRAGTSNHERDRDRARSAKQRMKRSGAAAWFDVGPYIRLTPAISSGDPRQRAPGGA